MGEEESRLMKDTVERKKTGKGKEEDVIKNMNFFKRMKLIKGTLTKLRERTSFKKMKFVKNHQLKIIQDYTYDIDSRKENDPLIYIKQKVTVTFLCFLFFVFFFLKYLKLKNCRNPQEQNLLSKS